MTKSSTDRMMLRRLRPDQSHESADGLSINLQWRLPNQPAVFVGRAAETEILVQNIRRGVLSAVVGPGGLGKSALVLHTLFTRFSDRTLRTIRIGMRPGDTILQLSLNTLRAVAASIGYDAQDWSKLIQSNAAVHTTLIDLVEEHDLWILLEDLHFGDTEAVDALLTVLNAYVRSSRWIVTMRRKPLITDIHEQVLELAPLELRESEELARSCVPDIGAATAARLATESGGSPWRLRQALMIGRAGANDVNKSKTMSSGIADVVAALSVLDMPIARESLERIVDVPDESEIVSLVDGGVLEPQHDSLRLHDKTREAACETLPESEQDAWQRRAAEALQGATNPDEQLEALRLLLGLGDLKSVTTLMVRSADDLIRQGFAPRLWNLLDGVDDAALVPLRLRLAAVLASRKAVEWAINVPIPEHPALRLLWATTCFIGGQLDRALAAVQSMTQALRPEDQHFLASQTRLAEARVLLQLCRCEDVLTVLDQCHPETDDFRARSAVYRARAYSGLGRYEEALAIVLDMAHLCESLPIEVASEVQAERAGLLTVWGRLKQAAEVLDALDARKERQNAIRMIPAYERSRRIMLAVQSGNVLQATELMQGFDEVVSADTLVSTFMGINRSAIQIFLGELDGVARQLEHTLSKTVKNENPYSYQWTYFQRTYLAWMSNETDFDLSWPNEIDPPEGPQAAFTEVLRWARNVRNGRKPTTPEIALSKTSSGLKAVDTMAHIVHSEQALVSGDADSARQYAYDALNITRTFGLGSAQMDVYQCLCDALLVGGQLDELKRIATEFETDASMRFSQRFQLQAQFFLMVSSGSVPSLSGLLECAGLRQISPCVADRANAILGARQPAHQLDEAVLTALQSQWPPSSLTITGGPPDAACDHRWGIDFIRNEIFLPPERRIDMTRHTLFMRILANLLEHGGESKMEDLAERVWDISTYHPLNDDRRIRVAVRRLRKLIEDDPAQPTRLLTTDGGYCLSRKQTCVVLRGSR